MSSEKPEFSVEAEPRYIERESEPTEARFVFAYTITIANHGAAPATLRRRYWLITDADGEQQEVRGPGVVGEEPCIQPGTGFRYTSAAVLTTAVGTMEGSYEFEAEDGSAFDVPIPVFSLSVPNVVH